MMTEEEIQEFYLVSQDYYYACEALHWTSRCGTDKEFEDAQKREQDKLEKLKEFCLKFAAK